MRYNLFKWRYETSFVNKVFLAVGFAFLTALLAQMRFYLPGNALIPITGQTFAILLAGVVLGKWGGVSQCIYVGLGVMGVPWFANVTGSTIGYLAGFIIAAFFLGFFTDKYVKSRKFSSMLPLMLFATFVLIYMPGLTYLYFYMGSLGVSLSLVELLTLAVVPFVIGDIIKAIAAASVAKIVTPKRSYGREVDIV
jgi:biotin transport system substrate-specific component